MAVPAPARSLPRGHARCAILADRPCGPPVAPRPACAGPVLPVLAAVPDPRARREVRHPVAVILGLAVCAVLAGARSFTAITKWAADADQATSNGLGVPAWCPASPRSAGCCRARTPMPWTMRPARGRSSPPPPRAAADRWSRRTARCCADRLQMGSPGGICWPRWTMAGASAQSPCGTTGNLRRFEMLRGSTSDEIDGRTLPASDGAVISTSKADRSSATRSTTPYPSAAPPRTGFPRTRR